MPPTTTRRIELPARRRPTMPRRVAADDRLRASMLAHPSAAKVAPAAPAVRHLRVATVSPVGRRSPAITRYPVERDPS